MRFSAIFVAAASLATLSLAAPITKPAALDARAKSDIETLSYGLCQAEAARESFEFSSSVQLVFVCLRTSF